MSENEPRDDFFDRFMFGPQRRPIANEEEQTRRRDVNLFWFPRNQNRAGQPDKEAGEEFEEKDPNNLTNLSFLDNIEIDELFTHFDTLMTSAGKLKPLFQKAKPFISQFLKSGQD
ncbi:hypothetical protein LS684_06070 [Cytobacillus spongiae]|uniref:hypothetical protein n=1 Tax=Cytobacillus spongiae TaxID=2901381 RepID=UPI001F2814D0|nr:hypothetical protein [Cytobacillus spongiae]UII57003.1 hypothetical protein LS684_06070 [Cytobacillus spongiae]